LTDGFRIFTEGVPTPEYSPPSLPTPSPPAEVTIHIGVVCVDSGSLESKSGVGVCFGANDAQNVGAWLPMENSTTKYEAELVAATIAVRAVPPDTPVLLISRNDSVATAMNKHLNIWEDKGWVGVQNPVPAQQLALYLRSRSALTSFAKPTSASTSALCCSAKDLARTAITESIGPVLSIKRLRGRLV
ncbi:hypothetical protein C8F04DRAFT_976334, partial [Mycena alexandri]